MSGPAVLLCPACRQVVPSAAGEQPSFLPFCSERCKLTDLGRWFAQEYTVPAPIPPEDSESIAEVLRAREAES